MSSVKKEFIFPAELDKYNYRVFLKGLKTLDPVIFKQFKDDNRMSFLRADAVDIFRAGRDEEVKHPVSAFYFGYSRILMLDEWIEHYLSSASFASSQSERAYKLADEYERAAYHSFYKYLCLSDKCRLEAANFDENESFYINAAAQTLIKKWKENREGLPNVA